MQLDPSMGGRATFLLDLFSFVFFVFFVVQSFCLAPIGEGQKNQAENELPQPQVVFALGLRITNWAPCRLSA